MNKEQEETGTSGEGLQGGDIWMNEAGRLFCFYNLIDFT